jgi:hypothetical protein
MVITSGSPAGCTGSGFTRSSALFEQGSLFGEPLLI